MNIEKLFSWRYIVCLSLIFTEKFFFTLRINASLIDDRIQSYTELNKFSVTDIIISVTVLFVFSICLIYLISKVIDKIHSKISFYVLILFTAFLVAISFKMFFDIADYPWSHLGPNIYGNIESAKILSSVKLLWFLTPFIISYIFVIFLQKNIHNIFNFLGILSLVLIMFMSYNILSWNKLRSSYGHTDKYFNNQTELKKQRKVVWILFDGFDPEIAFSNKEHSYKLSNFIELKNNSVTHHKLFAPADKTFFSIMSSFIGEDAKGKKYRNHRVSMISRNNKEIPFTMENTIFGRIKSDGFSSSITGYGFHPYCFLFKVKCKTFNRPLKWYDGILNILHVRHIYQLLNIEWERDFNTSIINSMYEFIESPTNLVFIHNYIPKLCFRCTHGLAGFAEKYYKYKFRAKDEVSAYTLTIKVIDSLLGEILNKLDTEQYKKEDTLLILSSDHWASKEMKFKSREMNPKDSVYPALFIAKILGDNQKIELLEPDSGIHIQELVHKFLKKEISTHLDIKHFFEQKSGYNVIINRKPFLEDTINTTKQYKKD